MPQPPPAAAPVEEPEAVFATPSQTPVPRRFFIDALNLAYWCGKPPTLRVPFGLMTHLLAEGHQAVLYFDASARYQLQHEADLYAGLLQHPLHCIEVPSGRSADEILLKQARASGACVLSRDGYRDHRKRYRKLIDDPERLIAGFVKDDWLRLPALRLQLQLPASTDEAWLRL